MSQHHVLNSSPETCHWGYFDASLKPVLTIQSGDRVTINTLSGGPGELPGPGFEILPEHRLVHQKVQQKFGPHILTGPVAIEGAQPGDVLEVQVEAIALRTDWGWNVRMPLRGSLPEDFPEGRRLLHFRIDRNRQTAELPWGGEIKLKPFFGIMAAAPRASYGVVSSVEPREFGGNIDNKEFMAGSTLLLPVWHPGGLFSTGDGHAVQGDGEVNLTALETSLTGTFKFTLHKKRALRFPRALTPTHFITMGMDPDLDNAAKHALRDMIALLGELTGLSAEDAYAFCSLACDLHVTQLVDGNKGVHAMFPRDLIERDRARTAAEMVGKAT